MLPVVAILLLAVVQVALVARDQVAVVHAAREGARAAAVDPDPAAPRRAALAGGALDEARAKISTSGRGAPGSRVTVEVRYRSPTQVPLVGGLVGDVELVAATTMRVET